MREETDREAKLKEEKELKKVLAKLPTETFEKYSLRETKGKVEQATQGDGAIPGSGSDVQLVVQAREEVPNGNGHVANAVGRNP